MKEKLTIPAGAEGFALLFDGKFRPVMPHHHDELEVNLILSGKAWYLFGNRRVPLRTGSMIWLFPRQEHLLIDWSRDFSMWVIVFKPRLVKQAAGSGDRRVLRSQDPGEVFCRQIDSRQVDFLNQVYEGARRKDFDLEFTNAALTYAIVASWQSYQFTNESLPLSDVHPAVAKAARIVATTEDVLPLEALAREAGLSPARLSRLFKQQAGISLTLYRQRKCLERFLKIYRAGARYTLIEAALLAGFGSYPQFHRVFCREMQMNPAAYRKVAGRDAQIGS